jgi:hypothetical protein
MNTYSCAWCAKAVQLPPRGWTPNEPLYCEEHQGLRGRDPNIVVPHALEGATEHLRTDLSRVPRWPWLSLDAMAGLLLPESVTYVAAFPGNGKTSFVAHCVLDWIREQRLRVLLMPLEASPREAVARLVCLEQGLDPDEALSLRLRQRADRGEAWARHALDDLHCRYGAVLNEPDFYANLMVEPADTLGQRAFRAALNAGAEAEVDVVVVDHVDHLGHDDEDARPEIARSTAIQHEAKAFTRRTGIPVVLMAQLNSKATGGSRTAYYEPPRMEWMWFKGVKEQIAHTVLGLFRPLRTDLTATDLTKLAPGESYAEPHTIGISGMKRRYGGAVRDPVVKLHFEHGLITERTASELLADAADAHGIQTSPRW